MSGSYAPPTLRLQCGTPTPAPAPADRLEWFAIQTRYRFEKKVAAQLEQKGCEVYLPMLIERHRWSDRQKNVALPLFPGYEFVHIDRSREFRAQVLQTSGLIGFVSFGTLILPVPAKQIADLQLLLSGKTVFSSHPFACAGKRVRIRGGCLQGIEGVLLQQNGKKLVISIDAIQRSVAVEISGYDLELV